MKFKYLTATLLRQVANAISHNGNYMCCEIDKAVGVAFDSNERNEFAEFLEECKVLTDGSLDHYIDGKWVEIDYEKSAEIRFMFLHMLANAIAYKAPVKEYEWQDPSQNLPSKPGVYEKDFDCVGDVAEFQYWDGSEWFYGNNSYRETVKSNTDKDRALNQDRPWRALNQDRPWREVSPAKKKS